MKNGVKPNGDACPARYGVDEPPAYSPLDPRGVLEPATVRSPASEADDEPGFAAESPPPSDGCEPSLAPAWLPPSAAAWPPPPPPPPKC
jgi:hypothetical protein